MNVGWVIFFAFLALLYGFTILGHFAIKYKRKKELAAKQDETTVTTRIRKPYISDEQMQEMMAATLKRMKENEKRAEEAQAALDELLKKEKKQDVTHDVIPRENVFKWETDENGTYNLIFIESTRPSDFSVRYVGEKYRRIESGEDTGISFYIALKMYYEKITAPISGILHFISPVAVLNEKVAKIDPRPEAVEEMDRWLKSVEEERRLATERRKRAAEEFRIQKEKMEKEEMARKIKEKYRKRQLEKIVRQELIDSGELFGDQPKRPPIPREVVDAVYRRDGGRCVYCGSTKDLQIDHIIPFSRGGSSELENLQLLCRKCNIEKSNKIG